MKKREQTFTTKFNKWAKYHWSYGSALVEIKVARDGKRIPISEIKAHQIATLRCAENFVHKFSDIGMVGTPTDVVIIKDGGGFIILNFLTKDFYIFSVPVYMDMIAKLSEKSITEASCAKYALEKHTL